MQSSSPHAGLVVFTALELCPRPAAIASLPRGISFDEIDSCRTLPKWNLCNQVFLCCSICLFLFLFFFQHRHLLPVALQPLVIRMDFILVMFDAPWMLGCSQSHSTFCLLALLGWNNLCRLHLLRLVWSYSKCNFLTEIYQREARIGNCQGVRVYHAPNLHPVVFSAWSFTPRVLHMKPFVLTDSFIWLSNSLTAQLLNGHFKYCK